MTLVVLTSLAVTLVVVAFDWALFYRPAGLFLNFGDLDLDKIYLKALWPRLFFLIVAGLLISIGMLVIPKNIYLGGAGGFLFIITHIYQYFIIKRLL